jgi:hypothetical protein
MSRFTPPIRRVNSGRGHTYRDANGNRVPGVTTLISEGVPKPALIDWAANTTADYTVDHWDELGAKAPSVRLKELKGARYADRDAAANKGTLVHNLAEQLIHGERVEIPDGLEGYVESYVRFLDEWDVRPIIVEAVVVSHQYGWAGTLDAMADLKRLGPALFDIKTSRSGVFGETGLQLAGYRYSDCYMDGDEELELPEVDWTGVVHVRSDGYSLVPVEAGMEQLRALRYVQQVGQFVGDSRQLVGEPLVPPAESRFRLIEETA